MSLPAVFARHLPSSKPFLCHDRQTITYDEFDSITSFLANRLFQLYGPRPTLAFLSENNPYMLALMLSVWKLGGIVSPMDMRSPAPILQEMLRITEPHAVVVCKDEVGLVHLVRDLGFSVHPFDAEEATVPSLFSHYLHESTTLLDEISTLPTSPDDIMAYLYSSSATTISNIKCIPLKHETALKSAAKQFLWAERNLPACFTGCQVKVLGWSPWSHAISMFQDISVALFAAGGAYLFLGSRPADISAQTLRELDEASITHRLPPSLLATLISMGPNYFAGVPFILDGVRSYYESLPSDSDIRAHLAASLQAFKVWNTGGAQAPDVCFDWAEKVGLKVVEQIGSTESGPLFQSFRSGRLRGYSTCDFLLEGSLELGTHASMPVAGESQEGELLVTSRYISSGYHNPVSPSPFQRNADLTTTYYTGDIWQLQSGRYYWKGRKDDFIPLVSGEQLDPSVPETVINECQVVELSCIFGNRFQRGASDCLYLVVQLNDNVGPSDARPQLVKALGTMNTSLPPNLRIPWSNVVILDNKATIPLSKKGAILRKKLEATFGTIIETLPAPSIMDPHVIEGMKEKILSILQSVLQVPGTIFEEQPDSSFAELGMNSAMAIAIVNRLNSEFQLSLPSNVCHIHIDYPHLCAFVAQTLGFVASADQSIPPSPPMPSVSDEIAIIGQALRLPGGVSTVTKFWTALVEKRTDLITSVPPHRWDHQSFYRSPTSTAKPQPGDITFEKAGFLDVEAFDNAFFEISNPEALCIAPATRLVLESAFEALENANLPPRKIKGTDMGVFVATGLDKGYTALLHADSGFSACTRHFGTGIANSAACGRLSYLLDVHGPSIVVDTACSSGLVAVHQAVQYLQSGGETALVVGANTHVYPSSFSFTSAQGMTSVNSRCATFTKEADGYVPSEGVGALILKRKSAALRDGDTVLGYIVSTDTKHNGRSQGLVAPSVSAQCRLYKSVVSKASLTLADIDFIEAHGTGTSLGDSLEIQAINDTFAASHSTLHPLIIGAAKSCTGHTEMAAGIIGIIKVLQTLSTGIVPGLTHLTDSNLHPDINTSVVPILIPHQPVQLQKHGDQKHGDVNHGLVISNGFAGSIAAAVIKSAHAPMQQPAKGPIQRASCLFVVSGKSLPALAAYLRMYIEFCRQVDPDKFSSICYTSCVGREHYHYRFACVPKDLPHLISLLEARLEQNESGATSPQQGGIIFGYPGQGSHYPGMGAELAECYPGFKDILLHATETVDESILNYIIDPKPSVLLGFQAAQVAVFVFQYSMSKWLASLGICPQAVLGHSIGEIAAAGIFPYSTALQFVAVRSQILGSCNSLSEGAMAAISAPLHEVTQSIKDLGLEESVAVAVYNSSESHVVSGTLDGVEALIIQIKQKAYRATRLNVGQAFHSPLIAPSLPPLQEWVDVNIGHSSGISKLDFFSTTLGTLIPASQGLPKQYWADHARHPVLLTHAARAVSRRSRLNTLLDIGPQRALSNALEADTYSFDSIPVAHKQGRDQVTSFLSALASVFERGLSINFDVLFRDCTCSKVQLPTYPYQRRHHYPSAIVSRNTRQTDVPLSESHQLDIDEDLSRFLNDHQIEGQRIVPAAAFVLWMTSSGFESSHTLRSIQFHRPLVLDHHVPVISVEYALSGDFVIGASGGNICSGTVAKSLRPRPFRQYGSATPASQVANKLQVYEAFERIGGAVNFGPLFQTIQSMKIWEDRAEATIVVPPSSFARYDNIRKLDACLHGFGAFTLLCPETRRDEPGQHLPSKLEGLIMYEDELPSSFICRYHLPIKRERNDHVQSVGFDIISTNGELLASCEKYSVAWIPRGSMIQEERTCSQWFAPQLVPRVLATSKQKKVGTPDAILLSVGLNRRRGHHLGDLKNFIIDLAAAETTDAVLAFQPERNASLVELLGSKDVFVILDMGESDLEPASEAFRRYWKQILAFMKWLMSGRLRIKRLLVVSYNSDSDRPPFALPTITSLALGMTRVYKRESGLNGLVTGVEIPSSLLEDERERILSDELAVVSESTVVVYRRASRAEGVSRFVQMLQRPQSYLHSPLKLTGITLIVGLGSIGIAFAASVSNMENHKLVVLGRRSKDDAEVVKSLAACGSDLPGYYQTDITKIDTLRSTLLKVQAEHFSPITGIFFTAGIIEDATINAVTVESFERVMSPKVLGAWNFHVLSLELKLDLKQFVLLSSISVPLGNPGQISYVASNNFLDSLARYRREAGLSGLSLQLGAWESNMLKDLGDLSKAMVKPIRHADGIPLIHRAMACPDVGAVQVIADLDMKKLAQIPVLAQDALFEGLVEKLELNKMGAEQEVRTSESITQLILRTLGVTMELDTDAVIDVRESLQTLGVDSIAFTQLRGRLLHDLGLELPMVYLSDAFTVQEMIDYVCETCDVKD